MWKLSFQGLSLESSIPILNLDLMTSGSYPHLGYPNASGKNVPCLDSTSEIKSYHSQTITVGYMTSKIDKSVCLSIQNQS